MLFYMLGLGNRRWAPIELSVCSSSIRSLHRGYWQVARGSHNFGCSDALAKPSGKAKPTLAAGWGGWPP